jgi:hypothetical protein
MAAIPISTSITVAVIHDHGLTNTPAGTIGHSCIRLGLCRSSLRAVFGIFRLGSRSCIAGHWCHFRVGGLLPVSLLGVGRESHSLWFFNVGLWFCSWI